MKLAVVFTTTLVLLTVSGAFGAPGPVRRSPRFGVEGHYIVALKKNIPEAAVNGIAISLAQSYGLTVRYVWPRTLRGFSCAGTDAAIDAMNTDPRIAYVEQIMDLSPGPQVSATQWAVYNSEYLWHLDRVDEETWDDRDSQHNMCTEGRDATVYLIDTGVRTDHEQFEDRVVTSNNFSTDRGTEGPYETDTTNGCTTDSYWSRWHGTATASVVGGTQIGVAKPDIISLRVADCQFGFISTESLQNALYYIESDYDNPSQPAVVSHSVFVPVWDVHFESYSDAVEGLVASVDIPFFASANNFSTDACLFSPADRAYTNNDSSGSVFVVGATSITDDEDTRYQWWEGSPPEPVLGQDSGSNSGACVSMYAPGVSIYVARTNSDDAYSRESGTSFAAPLAAGVAVRYMKKYYDQNSVILGATAVYDWLLGETVTDVNAASTYTPDYYYCAYNGNPADTDPDPGEECPTGTIGDPNNDNKPFHFAQVHNTSGAQMLYWDEANGGTCP